MPRPVISNLPQIDYPIEKTVRFVMNTPFDASTESLLKFLLRREQGLFHGIRNWRIEARLRKPGYPAFTVPLQEWQNAPGHMLDKARVEAVVLDLKQQSYTVDRISSREKEIIPGPPMSVVEWYLDPAITMNRTILEHDLQRLLAQQNDETPLVTALGYGLQPLPTLWYRQAREWIADHYEASYVSRQVRTFKPVKGDDIRLCPTQPSWTPKKMKKKLTTDVAVAYTRIWERAMASQMASAVVRSTSIIVSAGPKKRYLFASEGEEILSRGFLQSLPWQHQGGRDGLDHRHGAEIKKGDSLELLQVLAEPLSTPSTECSGAELYTEFNAVERTTATDFFNRLLALQERRLIEETARGWRLTDQGLRSVMSIAVAEKHTSPGRDHCPHCGRTLVTRAGPYGRFQSCSGYPACRYTQALATAVACPESQCTGRVVERQTKQGRAFYGCSRYPQCRFRSWDRPTGTVCPKCRQGHLNETVGRDGTLTWVCPQCQSSFVPSQMQLWNA